MAKRVTLSLLIAILLGSLSYHFAQAQAQLVRASVEHLFGEQITFRAEISSDAPVSAATVFFQESGDAHTNLGVASVFPLGDSSYELRYAHSLASYTIRAFSVVEYHFEIQLQSGELFRSQIMEFRYDDNRFEWQTLEEKPFLVHWLEGDLSFAQSILDAAQAGLKRAQNLLPVSPPTGLDIYAYPDSQSMLASLNPSSPAWVAGHADPDLGVIIVALPSGPEQRLLVEQRIPHELMHVLLYQHTGNGYANLPVWLNEGLASQVELFPNPDYRLLLDSAGEKGNLLPLVSLCSHFPLDASSALLSYAQSASFTAYLFDAYGSPGLSSLVASYASGLDCDKGARQALGKSLTQLQRLWQRESLSQSVALQAVENLLPWLLVLLAVMAAPLFLLFSHWRSRRLEQSSSP